MKVSNDAILPGCFIGFFQVKEKANCVFAYYTLLTLMAENVVF